jgi:SAM-dependent methyltransferase
MPEEDKNKYLRITEQNISFYNVIADKYDAILDKEASNQAARKKVAEVFGNVVKSGLVLDFGGGTGRDLDWLTEAGYKVIFCEPSSQMKEKAIQTSKGLQQYHKIDFLEVEKTDFATWDLSSPSFPHVDAILANFAVFNCIPDISLLFTSLSQVMKPGGHLFAVILHNHFLTLIRSHFWSVFKSILSQRPLKFGVRFEDSRQTVYVHSTSNIKRTSSLYFNFCEQKTLPGSGFVLIHLTRK